MKGVKTGEESSSVRQEVRKQDTADELDVRKMRQRETERNMRQKRDCSANRSNQQPGKPGCIRSEIQPATQSKFNHIFPPD